MSEAFLEWQRYARESPTFNIGRIVDGGCTTALAPDVIAAYDAPFPDDLYKAGARAFPRLVPTTPDDPASEANRAAWAVLTNYDRPFLTAFSDEDRILRGGERVLQKLIPGAAGQDHTIIRGGGHFLQEDRGPELAAVVVAFIGATAG